MTKYLDQKRNRSNSKSASNIKAGIKTPEKIRPS